MGAGRVVFITFIAVACAGASDLLVQLLADAGAFGAAYRDTDDAAVVPSLCLALLAALPFARDRFRRLARRASCVSRAALVAHATARCRALRPTDVAAVVALQFVTLFAMENSEALIAAGRGVPGAMWLGAPVAIAVILHALVGLAGACIASALLRSAAGRIAHLVHVAWTLSRVLRRPACGAFLRLRARRDRATRMLGAYVRRIAGRAPPALPAFAV